VGNDPGAAAIEATLVGPEIRLEQETVVAVAGANLSGTIDGVELPIRKPVRCRAGSVLRFGARRSGSRLYVAFEGGLDTPVVLGSRSTHVRSGLGGVAGRTLVAGDGIPLGRQGDARRLRSQPDVAPALHAGVRLRVMPGPEDDHFSAEGLDILQRTRFTVTPQSDRMGYRLQGGRIPRAGGVEMISDATFTGAIQVPPSGEPILLMTDRQTTGGYPQIATVITADLPLAAQLAPGDWVEFEVCTRGDAVRALVAQEGKLLAFS
jgi:antagonist of KipI